MISDPRLDRPSADIHEADYRVLEDGNIERAPDNNRRRWLAPLTAALIFFATKLKFVLAGLKGLPFFTTGITALVSIGAYALAFSWQFAVGLVILLFIHEMGHFIGLGHAVNVFATMAPSIAPCDPTKASLHTDDKRGARALYKTGIRVAAATLDAGNASLTVTNKGNVAFSGAGGKIGESFQWGGTAEAQHIFEASFAVARVGGPAGGERVNCRGPGCRLSPVAVVGRGDRHRKCSPAGRSLNLDAAGGLSCDRAI